MKYRVNFSGSWSIENLENSNKKVLLDVVDWDAPFGQMEFVDGKINWILDFVPPNEDIIDACKKQKQFLERASFEVIRLREKWEKVDNFERTFIDALQYIKEHFDEYRDRD